MTVRRALTWIPFVVVVGEIGTYFLLTGAASSDHVVAARNDLPLGSIIAIAAIVMCGIGCVIISKQPRNAIGWMFALIPLGFWMKGCSDAVVFYSHYAHHDAVPGGRVAAWMSSWDYLPPIATLGTFVPLLFPNGRLPSRRWRPLAVLAPCVIVLALAVFAFVPGPLDSFHDIRNPYGVGGTLGSVLSDLGAGIALLPAVFLLSAISLFFRARTGSAVLKAQVKWLSYALVVFAVGFGASIFLNFGIVSAAVIFGAVTAVPIASVIAITRYRLFDIDRLISRTLSYTIVTGLLVGVFAVVVFLPTALIGSEGAPNWLIALATLAAAALFRPVQQLVQTAVDRRFNRARYDSVRTVDEFASRLRDEIDIETLVDELKDVVGRSMQPASVSLWLRST